MADRITVTGVKPYDGEYEFDVEGDPFTTLEWRWVKKIAGYLPLTIGEGMAGADPDLYCAFAVIAMRRAGKIDKADALTVAERLADAPFGSAITIEGDPDEAEVEEEAPLGLTDAPPPPSEPKPSSSDDSQSRQPPSSGNGSPPSSDQSDEDPSPTGTTGSDTSPGLTVVGQAN